MSRYKLAAIAMLILIIGVIGCKPDYPRCAKDSHCLGDEHCMNNICQQCRDNGDCPDGRECTEGVCAGIPGYCSDITNCPAGQVCREHRCGPCSTLSECQHGQTCAGGRCGTVECYTSEDCHGGLKCVAYHCKEWPTNGAQSEGACNLEPALFGFNSSEMAPWVRSVIEANHRCLQQEGRKVVLEGHCDPRGTTEYNMALGERRANGVKKYLTNLGMDRGKVHVVSKGEEESTGTNESSWAEDRRVDFD